MSSLGLLRFNLHLSEGISLLRCDDLQLYSGIPRGVSGGETEAILLKWEIRKIIVIDRLEGIGNLLHLDCH